MVAKALDDEGVHKYKKARIPAALREQVWIQTMGHVFEGKCPVVWCTNNITVFDFQSGHNIPESRGGETTIYNLIPLCSRCNLSMGDQYTIDEWSQIYSKQPPLVPLKQGWRCC
jgi:5-methylcytosine-specific restriction endonuclease McrA